MRLYVALSAIAFVLVAAGTASAGGWASVKLAPPPSGIEPGDIWRAEITVLRHGFTPTDGARPSVTIRLDGTEDTTTFAAKPAGRTGVYVANVVFPQAGVWRYTVDNGLAATGYGESAMTMYAPVTIGSGAGGGGSLPAVLIVALAAVLGLAAAGGLTAHRIRRRPVLTH